MKKKLESRRLIGYLIGMNVLCIGINLNTRSGLGVAAFSTLPYSLCRIFPHLTFGQTNIIVYLLIVILQFIIERRFSWALVAEIPFSFVFGMFVDFYNAILPTVGHEIILRALILLLGNTCSAVGVFLMVEGDLVVAPVDGIVVSISKVSKRAYSLCKNCFDLSMVCITVVVCLACRSPFYGIGVGTIFSALYVGRMIRLCERVATKD